MHGKLMVASVRSRCYRRLVDVYPRLRPIGTRADLANVVEPEARAMPRSGSGPRAARKVQMPSVSRGKSEEWLSAACGL
jgi:hypothetical protein